MCQQVGEPFAVFDVCFSSRHGLDVLGICKYDHEAAFEKIKHRLPEHPGGFHRDVGAALFCEPTMKLEDLRRGRAKRSHLCALTPMVLQTNTSHDRLPMDIQAAAARVQHFYHAHPAKRARGVPQKGEFTWRAPRFERKRGQQYGMQTTRRPGPFFSGLSAQ